MSLYTKEKKGKDEVKPKSKNDILIATCTIDKKPYNVYWTDTFEGDSVDEIKCKNGKQVVYMKENMVYSCLISAPSGAGKSYLASELVSSVLKQDKKVQNIFYFTKQLNPDEAYANLEKKKRKIKRTIKHKGKMVEVDDEEDMFIYMNTENPETWILPVETFENSICLFDDWETGDKSSRDGLQKLLVSLLMRGRKLNCHVVCIIHTTLQANFSRDLHFESRYTVLFPRYQIRTTNSYLTNYMGFEKDQLSKIKKMNTRYIYISKMVPQYLISEDTIMRL